MLHLRPDFASKLLPRERVFFHLFTLVGKIYREQGGRRTLKFHHQGKDFFLKTHAGVGWKEIFKNLLQFRLPVVSAFPEWKAIHRLLALGVDTAQPVGYGRLGMNPAQLCSLLITEDVGDTVTVEDLLRSWKDAGAPPRSELALKRSVLRRVAEIARTMHRNGVNHRDFYACHLRIDAASLSAQTGINPPRIYVMDLHRAQLRRGPPPERWIVKDLASLYFSTIGLGITSRDRYRFIAAYTGVPLRQALSNQARLWERVESRALSTFRREQRQGRR